MLRFIDVSRLRSTQSFIMGDKSGPNDGNQSGNEINRRLQTLKISTHDILGKNYKAKLRHRATPSHIKPKMVQNQCVVYGSMPCTELRALKELRMPPVLLKKSRQKSAAANESAVRHRPAHRLRREGSVLQSNAVRRASQLQRLHRTHLP